MRAEENKNVSIMWYFQREIKRQCSFSLEAFEELDAAVRSYEAILGRLPSQTVHDEGVVPDSEEAHLKSFKHYEEEQEAEQNIDKHGTTIWFCIQNVLVSVANLSKLLWATGENPPNFSQRLKQELRVSLSIDEGSPLRSKKFRNYFEHFDEYLERWATEATNDTNIAFVDSVILPEPFELLNPKTFPARKLFRHYDPYSKVLTFQGKRYPLQPIRAAVEALQQEATAKVAQGPFKGGDVYRV